MNTISRRGFFQAIGGEAARVADEVSRDLGVKKSPTEKTVEEISIGRISDFPPGEKKLLQVGEYNLEIQADEEGIRARKSSGAKSDPIAIRLDKNGLLLAQLFVECSEREVFSLFCGEMKLV